MKQYRSLIALLLFGLLLPPIPASAYLVGPPLTLQQTADQSDLIVKAQVVSSQAAQDSWLGVTPGTAVEETRLKVVSILKGGAACPVISFRHYVKARTGPVFLDGPGPLCYQLTPGRTYLICAKSTGASCTYRQIWKAPSGLNDDQGVFLCADALPLADQELRPAVWHELTGLLQSPDSQDELYALRHLDNLSGGSLELFASASELDRDSVLAAIAPLLHSSDPEVTKLTLSVVAGKSAYFDPLTSTHWTPRRGTARVPEDQIGSPLPQIAAAHPYLPQILSLANENPNLSVRTLAIRALGGNQDPILEESELRWAGESQPQVRAAAALLLASDRSLTGRAAVSKLSQDAQPAVRASVARGIELTQDKNDLPLLGVLLHDADLAVREAAASSLATFPVGQTRDILRENVGDPDFKSIFLDVLAEEDPTPYLDGLAEVVEKRLTPPSFGGYLPDAEARQILFKSLSSQSKAALASEKWVYYMDVLERAQVWSSSEPLELYTFYVSHHMTNRAREFREASKTAVPFSMENSYDEVDKQAAAGYLRP